MSTRTAITQSSGITGTSAAIDLLKQLRDEYGPVLLHQSGGCCDGSVPLCLKQHEFRVSLQDVLFGDIDGTPFYVGRSQYEYLAGSPLILDAVPGDIDSFSLEAGSGFRFITRVTGGCSPARRV